MCSLDQVARTFALALAAALIGHACHAKPAPFEPSFLAGGLAGGGDADGHVLGGTEIRSLVTHGGVLYAGNGYWKDAPGDDGTPGAQIMALDAPGRPWRIEHEFADRLLNGRRRHLAVSALMEAVFRTDSQGAALRAPVSLLLASTWDVTGTRTVFVRDGQGAWSAAVLAQDPPSPGFLPQIRAFGAHRDARTGADLVFAGDTRGVFAGHYDPGAAGGVRWAAAPELTLAASSPFPGLSGRVRVSSFAEAQGRLFAAAGQQIWARDDGAAPSWRLLYTNPQPSYSQTGLRGLTAVTGPEGGQALLAAVEGRRSRIVRIDPATGAESTDLDLASLLDAAWGTQVSYVIAAYNDMPAVRRKDGGVDRLIGLEAFIPPAAPRPAGHKVLDVAHGLEAGGWLLVRHPEGRYELREVTTPAGQSLVAIRAALASPFPGQDDVVFAGGYDANDTPAHNTAWIAQGRLDSHTP